MNRHFYIFIVIGFVFCTNLIYAQSLCTQINLSAASTPSFCRSSGTIQVSVGGTDASDIRFSDALYQILPVGIGYSTDYVDNAGFFSEVPPGTYYVKMKAFCNKSSDWEVFEGSTTISVAGNYIEPNMYIINREVRKTLNCKVSGMIPIAFYDGQAPYTAIITDMPAEYTGNTTFTLAASGRLEINNLPDGNYTLTLFDNCNTKIENIQVMVEKVTSDFPSGGNFPTTGIFPISYSSTNNDCKSFSSVRLEFNPAITANHELYPYLANAAMYYDVYLTEDNNTDEKMGSIISSYITSGTPDYISSITLKVSLIDLSYGDLYPAGGHVAKVFFKSKNCNTASDKISLTIRKPYYNINPQNYTCTGFDLYMGQYNDYDGNICYPYTANVFDANTGLPAAPPKEIQSSSSTFFGTLPYGDYTVEYTAKDGGKWHPSSAVLPQKYFIKKGSYTATTYRNPYCQENGNTGYIYLNPISSGASFMPYFIPGTTIEVISAPTDQVIPPIQTINTINERYFYVYKSLSGSKGNDSPILAGEHKFKITTPCENEEPYFVTVNYPASKVEYRTSSSTSYCKNDLQKSYTYIYSQDAQIPGGTKFTYKSTVGGDPASVIHKEFTMPSGVSKYFTPFALDYTAYSTYVSGVAPGTYVFEIFDGACKQNTTLNVTVPKVYSVESFSYTMDHTSCSEVKIYPKGKMKLGNDYIIPYFRIYASTNLNGTVNSTYDKRVIREGDFLTLDKNGTYMIQISANSGSSACFSDSISIRYEQPMPRLDLSATASYVCNEQSTGFIKLIAYGGYGNGPFEYEIVGSSPPQKNKTGEFTYGSPNEVLTILVRDSSAKAIALGCTPELQQKVTMLNLKDASIAFSPNDGKLCEGGTIILNSVSLGNTTYQWTGPNGFSATGQFQTIPNATLNDTGWYYVSVLPENCGENKKDSIHITIYPLPKVPILNKTQIKLCYNSGIYNIITESGIITEAENKLKWYSKDGNTVISIPTLYTNSYAYSTDYYASQVNKETGCEGPKVKISIEIITPPLAPSTLYHPEVCYGDSVYLSLSNTETDKKYRMYASNSTSIHLDEKQGNGGLLTFIPQRFTSTSSSIYYFATIDENGCISSPRSSRTISLASSATNANLVVKERDTVCLNSSLTLTAGSTGITNPEYIWYNGPYITSDTLGKGDTYQTQVFTSTGSYNFYLGVKGDGICENTPSTRKLISIRVNSFSLNYYINASNLQICYGETVQISPTSSYVTNPTYYWYTSQTETIPFYIGNTLTTNSIFKDTVFYIGISGNLYCENLINNRKAVSVTLKSGGVPYLTQSTLQLCSSETATLTASSSGISNPVYKWYDSQTATVPVFTGNPLVVNNVTTVQTYWVSVSGTGICETLPVSRKSVTINPIPIANASQIYINDTMVCYNTSAVLKPSAPAVTSPIFTWYESQASSTPIATGNYTTPPISDDTVFYVSVRGTNYCENSVRKPVQVKSQICLEANDDQVFVLPCQSVVIDILANDNLHGNTGIVKIPVTGEEPNKGNIVKTNDDKITYTHTEADCMGGKVDTFSYVICTLSGSCDTAKVYVGILPKPAITLLNACSYEPLLEASPVFDGITSYRWEYATDQNPIWIAAPNASNSPLYKPTQEGKYRITISYNGKEISSEIKFIINKKVDINGHFWYDTLLEL